MAQLHHAENLCQVCLSIDFDVALCSPGEGGAPFQSWNGIRASAHGGCKLCAMISSKHLDSGETKINGEEQLLCCVWNYYDGEEEYFRGSACIIFYNSSHAIKLGISVDEGKSFPQLLGNLNRSNVCIDSELAKCNIISGRPLHKNATSKFCIAMIKSWIKDCLDNHCVSCPNVEEALPSRVVDVGSSSCEPHLHISNGQTGTWVALSHCWGKGIPFVTDSRNINERREKIMTVAMPKTFCDAISITRRLGYRYLWIDSLCILQDSAIDWAFESSRMQHYYKCSVLTIAADSAAGDDEGFLMDNRQSEVSKIEIPFNTKRTSNLTYAFIGDKIKDRLEISQEQTNLEQRAWTLQEDLLSPRTIHYYDHQLIWECQRYTRTETDSTPLGTDDSSISILFKRYFLNPTCAAADPLVKRYPVYSRYYATTNRWYQIFENYSNRLLTFEDDRFNAISGIAKELHQQSNMTYKAGIWMEDFRNGLLWCLDGRGTPPPLYRAPSWSWASMDVHKFWGAALNPHFELYSRIQNWELDATCTRCELLESGVKLATGDPFGRLLSGVIQLRGRWMPYIRWETKTPTYFNTFWYEAKSHIYWGRKYPGLHCPDSKDQLICSFDHESEDSRTAGDELDDLQCFTQERKSQVIIEEEEGAEEGAEGYTWDKEILQSASFLQIGRYTFGNTVVINSLILVPTRDSSTFQRVGIAEIPEINEQEGGWETRDINII